MTWIPFSAIDGEVEIAERMLAARRGKGISRRECARRMSEVAGYDVDYRKVWRWETGRTEVTVEALERFCAAIEVPVSEVMAADSNAEEEARASTETGDETPAPIESASA